MISVKNINYIFIIEFFFGIFFAYYYDKWKIIFQSKKLLSRSPSSEKLVILSAFIAMPAFGQTLVQTKSNKVPFNYYDHGSVFMKGGVCLTLANKFQLFDGDSQITDSLKCETLNPSSLEKAHPSVDGTEVAGYVKQSSARSEADYYQSIAKSVDVSDAKMEKIKLKVLSGSERLFRKQMRVLRKAEELTNSSSQKVIERRQKRIARILGTDERTFSFKGVEYSGTLSRNRAKVKYWLSKLLGGDVIEYGSSCGDTAHLEELSVSRLYTSPVENGSICQEEMFTLTCENGVSILKCQQHQIVNLLML